MSQAQNSGAQPAQTPTPSDESLGSSAQEQDDAVAWLESLAAKHGAKPEELVTDPNKRSETPPDWVSQAQNIGSQPAQTPTPSVESLGSSAQEQDDAVAWLESLAAKHGAKPEELVTHPNKRSETPPEWVWAPLGLTAELGAGKTCLVRGLAAGLGADPAGVHSPSFVSVSAYEGGRLPLAHVDLYRLEATQLDELFFRDVLFGNGVAAVEWFDRLGDLDVDDVLIAELAYAPGGRATRFGARGARHALWPRRRARCRRSEGVSMALVVQKYGGTSVADLDRIRHVADRVAAGRRRGDARVVGVSAMAGETNRLLALARQGADVPSECESDVLATTGEQVTAGLLALVIEGRGVPARSFLGFQIPIVTDEGFGRARIREIGPGALRAALARYSSGDYTPFAIRRIRERLQGYVDRRSQAKSSWTGAWRSVSSSGLRRGRGRWPGCTRRAHPVRYLPTPLGGRPS